MAAYTDFSSYTPGILFGNDALVPREGGVESSPSGFFDYLDRGVSSLGNIAREYLATSAAQQAAQAPERTTEYQFIPRDFGAGASSGGVSVSWQLVAIIAVAGFAFFALKGNG